MNDSVSSTQLLDKAIDSFLYFKSAEGLRDRSIDSYRRILNQCVEHWGPVNVTKVTSQDVSAYLRACKRITPHFKKTEMGLGAA